ncbi:hypothetical protein [Streptomyces sp. URMC 129]|uniref:hypothetical protein n=1 Tax=Streptomyces sp. URMC 129 TaxID=3423407 RepID=UPI003F1C0803
MNSTAAERYAAPGDFGRFADGVALPERELAGREPSVPVSGAVERRRPEAVIRIRPAVPEARSGPADPWPRWATAAPRPRLTDSPDMANSGLWVGVLTALTALGASYITARAALRAALAQARTTARAEALREQRDRRRASYREMLSCAHAFSAVTWQIDDVDAARDRGSKDRLLQQMYERVGPAIGDMNRAMHEVRLDGPAEVSAAADHVRNRARRLQPLLKALIGDDSARRRDEYDAAYRDFREAYVTFIRLAREALEVRDEDG